MPLYQITTDSLLPIQEASFSELKIRERQDLQRLIRSQPDVLGEELLILSEEFGDWEDSRRRIDLLALDQLANLVVIELKRTADGGHMELQSIRYASMVSTMTFARAVEIHAELLTRLGEDSSQAEGRILQFLGWEEPDEETFAPDVRIVLVSEDFGKELTTAVLWLRDREIDIRCVRLQPYKNGDAHLVDVQQIIPLPEANDYQVQVREKDQIGRKKLSERHELHKRFWTGLIAAAQQKRTRHARITPSTYHWIGSGSGVRGLGFNYAVVKDHALAELYIDRGDAAQNKKIFDALFSRKEEIEKACGIKLVWERLDKKRASRIKHIIDRGGYRNPEAEWPKIFEEMVTGMSALEAALEPELKKLEIPR
jgi:hypothetical protein